MIKINALNKYFNKGRQNELHVLNNVDLELPESGMVAIFGRSGCGKTTLLNVIGGLDDFAGGSVSIDGRSIRKDGDELRNEFMGYIFQNYNLQKSESCFDNVADALRLCGMTDADEIETRVMAALANVGMDRYRNRTPDTLSGGQQQRIAIARAIVKNPRIILADEPTGNLDEENTLMIMNLLRQIANDHLVLLVTHEANLVDYYCDTVIELKDGAVQNIRHNNYSGGLNAKNKNDIYLGELERSELVSDGASVEYYGDAPAEPIKLKIINNGGKLYVKIETEKVQVLDDSSEIKLREGVFEQKETAHIDEQIDMSALPPVKGTKFGKLFSFRSSVKSGYMSNFKSKKKGKNIFARCMCLFAVVTVVVTSLFGTSFADLEKLESSYNHNVFYVYTPDGTVSDRLLLAANDPASGIDFLRTDYNFSNGDAQVKLSTGFFETFSIEMWSSAFKTNAVYLDQTLCKDLELVVGSRDGLNTEDILITTAVADAVLDNTSLGYIDEYKDLLGMTTSNINIDGKSLRIAGIVRSDESSVYLTELGMAKYVLGDQFTIAEEKELTLESGKVIIVQSPYNSQPVIKDENGETTVEESPYPKTGETVLLRGQPMTVSSSKNFYSEYSSWLTANGIKKDYTDSHSYLEATLKEYLASKADPAYTEYMEIAGDRAELKTAYIEYKGNQLLVQNIEWRTDAEKLEQINNDLGLSGSGRYTEYNEAAKNAYIQHFGNDTFIQNIEWRTDADKLEQLNNDLGLSGADRHTEYNEDTKNAYIQGMGKKEFETRLKDWNVSDYANANTEEYESFALNALMWDMDSEKASAYSEYVSSAREKYREEHYFDYFEYYYAEFDQFIEDYDFFAYNFYSWLEQEKNVPHAKYLMDYNANDYYRALVYKDANGAYPKYDESFWNKQEDTNVRDTLNSTYQTEFSELTKYNSYKYQNDQYIVTEADYIALSKRIGTTTALSADGTGGAVSGVVMDGMASEKVEMSGDFAYSDSVGGSYGGSMGGAAGAFTVLHSNDPEKTAAYLDANFSDITPPSDYTPATLYPSDIKENKLRESGEEIMVGIISMVVILAVMSVCMFFIMRSSLMSRIKEIGIYRAIGVSKKNLTFKFLVESVVLTILTVGVGFIVTSAFVMVCLGMSPLMKTMFYYPAWLAGGLFAILMALCVFCGTLPIISLLRKTPSRILAKYDI